MNIRKEEKKSSLKRNIVESEEDSLEEEEINIDQRKKVKINEYDSESNEANSIEEGFDFDDKKSLEESSNAESSTEKIDLEDKDSIEEKYFKNLFRSALNIFQNIIPIERNLINQAVRNIKDSFKIYEFNSIDFNSPEFVYAYFENYSTLNAAVSRHRFLNAINNNEKLERCINKSNLRVISLGGGPGTDMIGFCSALQECRKKPTKLLNLCIVDKWKKWESFSDIIKALLREGKFGNVSKVFQDGKIFTSFIEVDLRDENPSQEYNLALKRADIVILARVLDSLNFTMERPEDMIHKIAQRMKENALLLLVDSGTKNYTTTLKEIYSSDLENFTLKNIYYNEANQSNAQIAVFENT